MNSKLNIALTILLSFTAGVIVFAIIFVLMSAPGSQPQSVTTDAESGAVVESDLPEEQGLAPEVSVFVTDNGVPEGFLEVAWNAQPVAVMPEQIGITESLYGHDVAEWLTFDELFKTYKVGEVASEPFVGAGFYVIERACEGPCGVGHYRVIDAREAGAGLILLENYSNDVFETDEQMFSLRSDIVISDLEMPSSFQIAGPSGILEFMVEPFTPAAMFNDYTTVSGHSYDASLVHPTYGAMFQDIVSQASHVGLGNGTFIVRVPDHTIKLYHLAFPFDLESSDYYGALIGAASLRNVETHEGEFISGDYSPISPAACPPRSFEIVEGAEQYAAALPGGEFYALENIDQAFVDRFWTYNTVEEMQVDADAYNLLFFKDVLDRWFLFRNLDIYIGAETECPYRDSVL